MRAICRIIVVAAGLVVCMINVGAVRAELTVRDFIIEGDIELGGRIFIDRPSEEERGKFEEYRDIPQSVFLENLHLQILDKDQNYVHELRARDAVEDDQYYYLKSSKVGLYTFEFEWDQIPHVFSTKSPLDDKISTRWDSARFSLEFTPTPEWDVFADYQFIDKHGDMPRGAAESPFRPGLLGPMQAFDFTEFLEPIRYNQHDMTVGSSYATRLYQVQLAYSFSLLENDVNSIIDPAVAPRPVDPDDRLALPPDNAAHTVALAGGVNLPYRTRINGTFSYGLRLQNDDLLPPSIPALRQVDVPEFDGEVNTYLLYLSALSRPIDPLTLKAMYRLYRYDDNSDEIDVPLSNEFGTINRLTVVRFPYEKQNVGFDAKWQFPWPVALILGYNFEQYDRDEELSADTSEHTPKIALNFTPVSWFFLEASYARSIRRGDNDSIETKIGHVPPPPFHPQQTNCASCHFRGSFPPFPLFNNFNMVDRIRDRLEARAELTLFENVSFGINTSLAKNDYNESRLGLRDDDEWSIGGDVTWRPWKPLALTVNYLREEFETRIRGEEDVDIDPGPFLVTQGTIDTVGAGINISLLPDKVDLEMKGTMSLAHTDFDTADLPDLDETFSQYSAYLRYRFAKHWTAKIGYIFEDFDVSNAYEHNVVVPPGNEFITDYFEDYTAHMIVLGLAYSF